MGQTTMLANLIDPEVLATFIDKKLIDNIVFAPLAEVDTTLVGAPGSILTMPYYEYVGAADTLTEASAISTVSLNASTVSCQIREAGKGIEISDTAMLAAYGNPVEEIGSQLVKSIGDKVDIDFLTTMGGATQVYSTSTSQAALGVQDFSNALELFGEDIDGRKSLLVSPKMYTAIRNTKDWAPASEFAAGALVRGAVGQIFGCDIIVSNRLRNANALKEVAYIVKPRALRLVLKRNTLLEADRDILRRVNVYTATKHYVTYRYNESGIIKLKVAQQ